MHKIFILFTIIAQMCFASPFDITDKYEKETSQVIEDIAMDPIIYQKQQIIKPDTKQSEIDKIQSFIRTNKAKLIMLDIKNGSKKNFILTKGDSVKIDNLNISLISCNLEKDPVYDKISLAELLINDKILTFSNDNNLNNIKIKNMLLVVDCYD